MMYETDTIAVVSCGLVIASRLQCHIPEETTNVTVTTVRNSNLTWYKSWSNNCVLSHWLLYTLNWKTFIVSMQTCNVTGPVNRKTLVTCRLDCSESATRCNNRANFVHPLERSWGVSFGKLQVFLLSWTFFCLGYKQMLQIFIFRVPLMLVETIWHWWYYKQYNRRMVSVQTVCHKG